MWTYFLIPYLMLFYFSRDVEGVCQNDESDALCNQRASDGECYFSSVFMGCRCALACQSLSSCPNHPSDGDTDCSCRIAHIVGECGVNKTKCPHTCHLRDVVTCDGLEVVSGAAASKTNPRYLDIVTYNCLPGYDFVNGSSGKRVCTEDGSWFKHVVDGTAPYCKKVSCGLSPSFENVTASHGDGLFGDVISYSCNTHYLQVGGSNGSMRCNETGSWDPDLVYGDLPLCEEVSCGLSPSFENVTASHGDGVFGDVISYSCNTHYIQVGGSNGSMRCNETGSWDPDLVYGDLPLCEEVSCGLSPSFENVTASHGDGVFGDVISYSCNAHYIQVGGSNGSMRCNETGSWDPDLVYGDLPLCEEVSCGLSPSFENVTASHGDGVFGDVISYSCNAQYLQVGGSNGSMRCNETGSWDPDLVHGDLPLCEEISTTNYLSASSVTAAHNAASTLTSTATSVTSESFMGASFSILTDHWSDSGSIPTSSTPTPYTAIPSEYTLLPPTLSEMVTFTSATVPLMTATVSTLAVSLSTSYNIDDATVLVMHCFPVNVTRSSDAYTENIPITKKFVPKLKEAKGGKALGSVAIIILVSSMLCVVIVDLMSIKRHCKSFKTNLRAMKIRCREVSNDDVVHFEETKPTGTKAADDSDKVDSVVEIS